MPTTAVAARRSSRACTPPRPAPPRTAPDLTDLDPTSLVYRPRIARRGSRQNGQLQLWGARSADRRWDYERTETAGTPWLMHQCDRLGQRTRRSTSAPSLDVARALTRSGAALRQIATEAARAARPRCTWRSPWGTGSVCSRPAAADGRCDTPAHAVAVAS